MRKQIIFGVALLLVALNINSASAQTQGGQIVISGGVGYGPEFDGQIFFMQTHTLYPVGIYIDNFENGVFICSSITPNIGATLDYGVGKTFSFGIASSYQSEIVNWANDSPNIPLNFSDKITRINISGRFLYHVYGKNNLFDFYFGTRLGISFWHDIPSQNNLMNPGSLAQILVTFIDKSGSYNNYTTNLSVLSFQELLGLRYFPIYNVGIHAEFGIGSPYLCESGITFRINTRKEKPKSDAVTPANK